MGKTNRISLTLCTITLLISQGLIAGDLERRQAKRIHDRLTGINAPNATIDAMESLLVAEPITGGKSAAQFAIDPSLNPAAWSFYNVTLKNFAAPWTNEEQTVFTPLNDYTATVIGAIRDGHDFRRILYDDILYVGNASGIGSYSPSNNNHYEALEALDPAGNGNLFDTLQQTTQSAVSPLPSTATAGIMTTRAASMAFFSDGTNRAMFRFTLMNHLCTDLEPIKDVSRTPDRVRRDVSRSPGGDSRIFLNACVGCHAGMDGMAGAFAYYEWDYTNDKSDGSLLYTEGAVSNKHNINQDNFRPGYLTTDDSWVNYWRNGPNYLLGWSDNRLETPLFKDDKNNTVGNGAKSLGEELANSDAFAQCQVDKVFETLCLRGPAEYYDQDRVVRDSIVNNFKTTYNYNMREVFTDVAAHCKGN
ncbi:MAG: hypothetical protein OEO19_01535 [Gammaproteobacteria bacterium]|nr:hypothetical protein [Gammaproteobacteria bacterium]MDH3447427.1 hypothetical protein [Gammaproteobacteria bacterium]